MASPYGEERIVIVDRSKAGFGFNIKGTTQDGGTLQAINGKLYAPLQYVSAIDQEGSAYQAGLRCHDRILEVNGQDIQGASHNHVVNLVLRGGDQLTLKVIGVSDAEAARLQRIEDRLLDDSKKPPVGGSSVSVTKYRIIQGSKPYTVYLIEVNGRYRCSRRYSQFEKLHSQLKARFKWYDFPSFPGKRLNGLSGGVLSEDETEERRVELDAYLSTVMAVEDIFNSDYSQSFLKEDPDAQPSLPPPSPTKVSRESSNTNILSRPSNPAIQPVVASEQKNKIQPQNKSGDNSPIVALKSSSKPRTESGPQVQIMLASHRVVSLSLASGADRVMDVEKIASRMAELGSFAQHLYGLFVAVDASSGAILPKATSQSFEKKLRPMENVSAYAGHVLYYRRWIFCRPQEVFAEDDSEFISQTYTELCDGIEKGVFPKNENLEKFRNDKNPKQFVVASRKVADYSYISFPPCASDFPEENSTVVLKVNYRHVALVVCDEDGTPRDGGAEVTHFAMEIIERFEKHPSQNIVKLRYTTGEGEAETITFKTPHAEYFIACIARVKQEIDWNKQLEEESPDPDNFFRRKEK